MNIICAENIDLEGLYRYRSGPTDVRGRIYFTACMQISREIENLLEMNHNNYSEAGLAKTIRGIVVEALDEDERHFSEKALEAHE